MDETDEPKTRFVNYNREPASERAKAFVADAVAKLLANETRQRKRRPRDQENFHGQASALICDLCHDTLTDGSGLHFRRSHRAYEALTRYDPNFLTKKVTDVVDMMIASELAEQVMGQRNPFGTNVATLIRPTRTFIEALRRSGLSVADFARGKGAETIILREPKPDHWSRGKLADYQDDETTNRYREEIRTINQWLAEADLGFDHPLVSANAVDVSDRHLSRIFTGSFDRCGRLYGGYWQPLKKELRREGLRINGEPVAVLDFGQMIVRLAYGHAGARPPEGDAYCIEPYGPAYREGFKTLISAMLFNDKEPTKKPKGTKDLLPKGDVEALCQAVKQAHPSISHLFGAGKGLSLMFQESEILIEIIRELMAIGITALPIHDAIAVSIICHEQAIEIMRNTFRNKVGVEPIIKIE